MPRHSISIGVIGAPFMAILTDSAAWIHFTVAQESSDGWTQMTLVGMRSVHGCSRILIPWLEENMTRALMMLSPDGGDSGRMDYHTLW